MKKGILFLTFVGALAFAQSVFAADVVVEWTKSAVLNPDGTVAATYTGRVTYEVWGGVQGKTPVLWHGTSLTSYSFPGMPDANLCAFVIAYYREAEFPQPSTSVSATACNDFSLPAPPVSNEPRLRPSVPQGVSISRAPK